MKTKIPVWSLGLLLTSTLVAGELFPTSFMVEHQLIQTEHDGDVFAFEPVIDYYGGSRIISVRPNGSRVIVDFARREITEIYPERASYTVIDFRRLASLRARLQEIELTEQRRVLEKVSPEEPRPLFDIEEIPITSAKADSGELFQRADVIHMRVALMGKARIGPHVDVWMDPVIKLEEEALQALAEFEHEVLGTHGRKGPVSFAAYVAAARLQGAGAVPVRTLRPASPEHPRAGTLEDRALRLEQVPFPIELLEVPESFNHTVHPLERLASAMEEEHELWKRGIADETDNNQ